MGKTAYRGFAFGAWLIAATLAATSMTAWHALALPVGLPSSSDTVPSGRWRLTHYLSADCACSHEVARYLIQRQALHRAAETVAFIGPGDDLLQADLARAGYEVSVQTAQRAASEAGVNGVPLLQITSPAGSIAFRGGYRDMRVNPARFLDLEILDGLVDSRPIAHPRVYGCATTRRLRMLLDPLSLKSLLSL